MPEFKQYDGVKSDSVAAKFTTLIEEHKKRIQNEPFRSGADDEEYDELERLLQDALDIQANAVCLRSELHQHEIEQGRKNAHDDAAIIDAPMDDQRRRSVARTKKHQRAEQSDVIQAHLLPAARMLLGVWTKQ
jgi:hypothetical protein